MRRITLVRVALLIVAVAGGGCAGLDSDDQTRIYFIDGYRSELGMRGRLIAVERSLVEPGLGRVVAEVLRGPTATERDERGLVSAFPPDVRVSTVALVEGTARVRLDSETLPRRWRDGFYATAQLVYTLTERDGVERVVMTVNGVRCCVYDIQHRPWATPLTRRNFASWQGAPLDG